MHPIVAAAKKTTVMTTNSTTNFYAGVAATIEKLQFDTLTATRLKILQPLIDYIQNEVNLKNDILLNLICTHNSRRSHLAQIWLQTAATYYNIKNVYCYSGGTQATELFWAVATTLQNQGFLINQLSTEKNSVYAIKFAANEPAVIGFSKKYDAAFNPSNNFAAIMTCTDADLGCPIVAGAKTRIAIPFNDPKIADNTPQQAAKYAERSVQIATEMFYVLSKITL